jgi:hypothetical protein
MRTTGSRLFTRLLWVSLLVGAEAASGQETDPQALEAALEWLILLDNGQYGRTWDTAADLFQTAITRDGWITRITSVKAPLGRLVARQFKSSEPVTNPAGVPEGEYLVIRFTTSFENSESSSETLVLHHGPEGEWKVSGYFIRPAR